MIQLPDGSHRFTPVRQKLHNELIKSFLRRHTPSTEPTYNILGGGPAAGKSTMVNSGKVEALNKKSVLVNADEMKERLPEYEQMVKNDNPNAGGARTRRIVLSCEAAASGGV